MVRHPVVVNAGNLVRIEDGCATVRGYKLPSATGRRTGKAGARFEAPSQYISLTTLVAVDAFARSAKTSANFSDKEKDEASPLNCFQWGR
jgi:hypothetical protein